jgi:hypothetical protein
MLGFMFLPFHTKLSKVLALGYDGDDDFLKQLLIAFLFLLLTDYSAGIHEGVQPTINFKVNDFSCIAASTHENSE